MRTVPSQHRDVFARYVTGPTSLRRAIAGSDRTHLGQPGPDGWSVRNVMLHLADSEVADGFALRSILSGSGDVPPVEGELWRRRLSYLWRDAEAAIALFELLRFSNAELLQHADNPAWKRRARRGGETVGAADVLLAGVEHCERHIAQIESLLAAV